MADQIRAAPPFHLVLLAVEPVVASDVAQAAAAVADRTSAEKFYGDLLRLDVSLVRAVVSVAHDVTSGVALAFVLASVTARRKPSTISRSLALWMVSANCVGSFVFSRLSVLIASSKSRKAKSGGGGFGAGGGTAGGGPSKIAAISGSSAAAAAVSSPPS